MRPSIRRTLRTPAYTTFALVLAWTVVGCSSKTDTGDGTGGSGNGGSGAGGSGNGGSGNGGSGNGGSGTGGSGTGGSGTGGSGTGGSGTGGSGTGGSGTGGSGTGGSGTGDSGTGGTGGSPSGASEWLSRGGDLSSNYNNTNETTITPANAATLHEAWTKKTSSAVNGMAPAADGHVYALAVGGLTAFNADGSTYWTSTIYGQTSPTLAGGVLYVNDAHAVIHALDPSNGHEQWKTAPIDPHTHAAGYSSPIVFEKFVIVGSTSSDEAYATTSSSFRGSIVAYDKANGHELWRRYSVQGQYNGASTWSSPAVDPSARLVFGATGNNYTGSASDTSDSLFALKVDTGEQVWNTQLTTGDVFTTNNMVSTDSDFGANPILFEATIGGTKRQLVGAGQKNGTFTALDRATGAVVWSLNMGPGSALIGGMLNNGAFDGEHIIVSSNNGVSNGAGSEPKNGESGGVGTSRLAALNPADGTVVWERQLPANVWSPISIANGVGFVSYEKHVQAFNVKTGAKLAVFNAAGTVASGISIADGHVYFGSGLSYYVGVNDNTFHCLTLP